MANRRYSKKRRRDNLMKKNPRCYWCGIEVVYFELPRFMTMPDNFATIDHLHTRYTPEVKRATASMHLETTVLACYRCNQKRCDTEQASIPKEELWRRAGAYPIDHPLKRDYKKDNHIK